MLHLSDINIYNDGSVSVKNIPTEPPPPVDVPVNPADRFAVANETSLPGWWNYPEYSTWSNIPMTNKQCDTGYTTSRGRNFVVPNSLWDFIYQLNDAAGIKFIESVGRQICNRPWIDRNGKYRGADTSTAPDDPENADPFMNAEPIILPPNVYQIIDETPTHYRVDALYIGMDWKSLDPKEYNWVNKPWLFPKCSAENRQGHIQNVMSGIDAFWVTLCQRSGAWILKELMVLPPPASDYVINGQRGVGYKLRGANWIMGLADGSQVTVRQVTKAGGIKEFYGWHLNSRSVVPPSWFE